MIGRFYLLTITGPNRALWECPDGHTFTAPILDKHRRAPLPAKAEQRRLAHHWSKLSGGVASERDFCPICREKGIP